MLFSHVTCDKVKWKSGQSLIDLVKRKQKGGDGDSAESFFDFLTVNEAITKPVSYDGDADDEEYRDNLLHWEFGLGISTWRYAFYGAKRYPWLHQKGA